MYRRFNKILVGRKFSTKLVFDRTSFVNRHVGSTPRQLDYLSQKIGHKSTNDLIRAAIPDSIRDQEVDIPFQMDKIPKQGLTEQQALNNIKQIAQRNQSHIRSMIGMGYYDTITPPVLLRNFIENPGWYTPYTPYQAELAQGRLESLVNYQTMISDLTGLPYANSSLLDEASAAAEAMMMSYSINQSKIKKIVDKPLYLVDQNVHPQTINLLRGRAERNGIDLQIIDLFDYDFKKDNILGLIISYPSSTGSVYSVDRLTELISNLRTQENKLVPIISVATDLMALTLLKPPGEFGADIAFGNSQRFGVPLGCGGPHAAFFATIKEYIRKIPGRIIGYTRDSQNNQQAYRLTLQTREQHIKRDKATSNICTAQALLANLASFYAIYHGPKGLKEIATGIHQRAQDLSRYFDYYSQLISPGHPIVISSQSFFDTIEINFNSFSPGVKADQYIERVRDRAHLNLRRITDYQIAISIDETTTDQDLINLVIAFFDLVPSEFKNLELVNQDLSIDVSSQRTSDYLTHRVFNSYHTETGIMRYLHQLQVKDLGLDNSMIPLGSCTMKLNAVSEMMPISWPEFNRIHPYAPIEQQEGYIMLTEQLRRYLADITGFADLSLQPNSGATGEYTGLCVIAAYLEGKQEKNQRNICLIPDSAHGTNPASAAMAGFKIVTIKTDAYGNVDFEHLTQLVEKHSSQLGALMITYPSTFGVFEERVKEICDLIHQHGGQVYMDGANMNAQVGITSPGLIGADVCHLNLHKTFCIPHGGGGPGMGPIGVAEHLVPYLPKDPLDQLDGSVSISPVAGSRWSSASILPITYQYITMMGGDGLLHATRAAIVNANYMLWRLRNHYTILYTNSNQCCAHEFIIDLREFFNSPAKISAIDIGKRLQDYGFHAPTLSWPIPNTMMIEPTESETRDELDRYCDALISIRQEIQSILDQYHQTNDNLILVDNLIKNSPHTIKMISTENWDHPYSRKDAAYPLPYLEDHKHWPTVGRVDEVYGDRQLITTHNQYK